MTSSPAISEVSTRRSGSAGSNQCINSSFHSASELKQLFKLIGKDFDAVQLSHGALQGRFRIANLGSIVLLELQTNQRLLLNGERGSDCMSFCFEATGLADEHRLFNLPLTKSIE